MHSKDANQVKMTLINGKALPISDIMFAITSSISACSILSWIDFRSFVLEISHNVLVAVCSGVDRCLAELLFSNLYFLVEAPKEMESSILYGVLLIRC